MCDISLDERERSTRFWSVPPPANTVVVFAGIAGRRHRPRTAGKCAATHKQRYLIIPNNCRALCVCVRFARMNYYDYLYYTTRPRNGTPHSEQSVRNSPPSSSTNAHQQATKPNTTETASREIVWLCSRTSERDSMMPHKLCIANNAGVFTIIYKIVYSYLFRLHIGGIFSSAYIICNRLPITSVHFVRLWPVAFSLITHQRYEKITWRVNCEFRTCHCRPTECVVHRSSWAICQVYTCIIVASDCLMSRRWCDAHIMNDADLYAAYLQQSVTWIINLFGLLANRAHLCTNIHSIV